MPKLKLEIDALRVESFGTDQADAVRGTVAGHNEPPYTESCGGTCDATCVSCVNTCLNTCQDTCYDTCNTCLHTCEWRCTHITVC